MKTKICMALLAFGLAASAAPVSKGEIFRLSSQWGENLGSGMGKFVKRTPCPGNKDTCAVAFLTAKHIVEGEEKHKPDYEVRGFGLLPEKFNQTRYPARPDTALIYSVLPCKDISNAQLGKLPTLRRLSEIEADTVAHVQTFLGQSKATLKQIEMQSYDKKETFAVMLFDVNATDMYQKIKQGDSGSPVLDSEEQILGVVSGVVSSSNRVPIGKAQLGKNLLVHLDGMRWAVTQLDNWEDNAELVCKKEAVEIY